MLRTTWFITLNQTGSQYACLCMCVCLCVHLLKNHSREMKPEYLMKQLLLLLSFFIHMAFAIDIADGRDLTNEAHHELLSKKRKLK